MYLWPKLYFSCASPLVRLASSKILYFSVFSKVLMCCDLLTLGSARINSLRGLRSEVGGRNAFECPERSTVQYHIDFRSTSFWLGMYLAHYRSHAPQTPKPLPLHQNLTYTAILIDTYENHRKDHRRLAIAFEYGACSSCSEIF